MEISTGSNASVTPGILLRSCYVCSYLVVRQLISDGGESYVNDLINSPYNYLIPANIKRALEDFTVPDTLSVFGGNSYKKAKQSLENSFVHFAQREKFSEALDEIRAQVRLSLKCIQSAIKKVSGMSLSIISLYWSCVRPRLCHGLQGSQASIGISYK